MTAAVITGASAGLGAEFTRQLVREFPDIEEFWLIARRVGKLEELAQQFPEKKFVCIGLNLLDPKSFRYLGEKLAEQKVDVRLLVNNAGCGTTGNIGASASSADVMRVVDLNVRALTMVTQTVVPFMTRGAKIINVSSIAAFCPTPRMTVYSASKAYVSAFTGGLADELRPKGITVTAVCPAAALTGTATRWLCASPRRVTVSTPASGSRASRVTSASRLAVPPAQPLGLANRSAIYVRSAVYSSTSR